MRAYFKLWGQCFLQIYFFYRGLPRIFLADPRSGHPDGDEFAE